MIRKDIFGGRNHPATRSDFRHVTPRSGMRNSFFPIKGLVAKVNKSRFLEGTERCSHTNRRAAPRCARTSAILAPARVETRAQKLFSSPSSMFLELTGATTLGAVRTDAAAKLVQGCGKAAIGRAALAAPWPCFWDGKKVQSRMNILCSSIDLSSRSPMEAPHREAVICSLGDERAGWNAAALLYPSASRSRTSAAWLARL